MAWSNLVRSGSFPAKRICPLSFPRRPAVLQTRLISIHSGIPPARQIQLQAIPPKLQLRQFHSTLPTMTSIPSELKKTLTPALLDEVRDFWFSHFSNENAFILPGMDEMMKWFKKDEEFDNACVAQFQPALESILASGASATDILDAFDSKSPLTWLSLIILLDQVPRNCYRGDKSKLVFERFDPLAQEIALRGIKADVPVQSSHMRYRLAYRFWFHLPLMHSESLAVHEQAIKVHEDTAKDMEELLQKDIGTLDEDEKMCYTFLSGQKDALSEYLSNGLDFEKRHKVIIERFGRYPHRNPAMGREPTKEEIDYLENGGETFG